MLLGGEEGDRKEMLLVREGGGREGMLSGSEGVPF